MSQIDPLQQSLIASAVPGVEIIARVRRLLVVGLLAAFGYSMLMVASKGYCPGGVNADGSFIDMAGNRIETAPICVSLTLRPSAIILVAIAVIAVAALTMVLRRATDVASAIRYLDRAVAAIAIVVVASIVIGQIWFGLIPITDWDGAGRFIFPFPFGSVEVDTAPMAAG